ncbi:phage major capsid protein [Hymenobacter sp. M29]|uniref:Phage major capsid protein n=1 Tax=Hymenobacter mellowenesis TaxID=3063995 RepID=A0ABT9AE70_9BACT|nr:phage major capsid protein [Hymenobacter sp. M29]MDO7847460.1 phage major capsid protein [Hymenobacter sp. M29]
MSATNEQVLNVIETNAVETKSKISEIETKAAADLAKLQEQFDALEAKANRAGLGGAEVEAKSAFLAAVETKAAELHNLSEVKSVTIPLSTKAAVDMFSAAGANFIGKTELGYQASPTKPTSISRIVSAGQINTPSISYVRVTGYEGGPQMVAEGAKKPNFSLTTESIDASVKKIAVTAKFSEEATKDATTFVSLVQSEMVRLHNEYLDFQSLMGSGTGNDLQGIYPLAKPFNAGYFTGTVPNAQKIDVLRVAIAQARIALFTPTYAVMNPVDVADLELQKDSTGSYMLPTIYSGQLPSIGRVQIVELDDLPQGQFVVGAFDRGAKLYTRDGLTMRVYDQNEDDALKNMVLVVLESRHVQLVNRPEAFIKGSFATAITALNKVA